jgi:hypothetical protein
MKFFTITGNSVLDGIAVFGDKLGSADYPLASVSLSEGTFPKVLVTTFDKRIFFSINGARPNGFIDRGYFYQFKGEDHCGKTCKLMPVIIPDQPYYSSRAIVMIAITKDETISHERGTDTLWECCLPEGVEKYSYIKLIGIEKEGWIEIKSSSKNVMYQYLGNRFSIY